MPASFFMKVTLSWFASIRNDEDAPAPASTMRLYYGERELASQAVRSGLTRNQSGWMIVQWETVSSAAAAGVREGTQGNRI